MLKRLYPIFVLVSGLITSDVAAKGNLADVELVIDDEVMIAPASANKGRVHVPLHVRFPRVEVKKGFV